MDILDKLIPHIDHEQLTCGEAYSIWTQVTSRYDTLELAEFLLEFVHDRDLKLLINNGIKTVIKPQIEELEDFAKKYNIPLPPKGPSSTTKTIDTDMMRDQNIFRIILDGSQVALLKHVKEINIAANDELRGMYKKFLKSDLDNYDSMMKYGKYKSWVLNPPLYKS